MAAISLNSSALDTGLVLNSGLLLDGGGGGIATLATAGTPTLTSGLLIGGIATLAAVGAPIVGYPNILGAGGIASVTAVGYATLTVTGSTATALTASLRAVHSPVCRVKIKWDRVNWTDETGRLEGIGGVSDIDPISRLPNIEQVSLELDNTDHRFSAKNTAGPLYAYLGAIGHPVQVEVGYDGLYQTFFYGSVSYVQPDARAASVQIGSLAAANRFVDATTYLEPTGNALTSDLARRLLLNAGFVDGTDFSIQPGTVTVQYAAVPPGTPLLQELIMLAQTENGRLHFDPANNGRVAFYNATVVAAAEGSPLAVLTTAGHAYDLDRETRPEGISNDVTVEWVYRDYKDPDTGAWITQPLHSNYLPQAAEQQLLTFTGQPTGGTYTLAWNGQTTSAIAYSTGLGTDLAATIRAALEALSNINPGDVEVTAETQSQHGGVWYWDVFRVLFTGQYAGINVSQMTVGTNGLTGGTAPSLAVTTLTQGAVNAAEAPVNEVQVLQVSWSSPWIPTGTIAVTFSGQTTTEMSSTSLYAYQLRAALEALSNINPGDVEVDGYLSQSSELRVTFKGQYLGVDVPLMTVAYTPNALDPPGTVVTPSIYEAVKGKAGLSAPANGILVPSTGSSFTAVTVAPGGGGAEDVAARTAWLAYVPGEWATEVAIPIIASAPMFWTAGNQNAALITTSVEHNLTNGQEVVIRGHSGSVPDINGTRTAYANGPTSFIVAVPITQGGTVGVVVNAQAGPVAALIANTAANFTGTNVPVVRGTVAGPEGVTWYPSNPGPNGYVIGVLNSWAPGGTAVPVYIRTRVLGHPAPQASVIVASSDATSIANFGRRKLGLLNAYKPDETMARAIVAREVTRRKDATDNVTLGLDGIPLRAGDIVSVQDTTIPNVSLLQTRRVLSNEWSLSKSDGFRSTLKAGVP